MEMRALLETAVQRGAADIYMVAGLPCTLKIAGAMHRLDAPRLRPEDTDQLLSALYALAQRPMDALRRDGDDEFSFAVPGLSRFRISAYLQRGSLAAVIRVIAFELPEAHGLGIPDDVLSLSSLTRGLVLVTGPAGSGKSTTLACLIDRINRARSAHIITLEDPLEFLHPHQQSIVSQREIGSDARDYPCALRSALRQSPDVILLGEMRDYETISIAVTAAETGHLVFSSLHTVGAVNTVDRIIDVFPHAQQAQTRMQLSMVLRAVVSQQLVPAVGGGMVPAFEIMRATPGVGSLIREGKAHQLATLIQASGAEGMRMMDDSLLSLTRAGTITADTALHYAVNRETMARRLQALS